MARESVHQKLLLPLISIVIILAAFIIFFTRQLPSKTTEGTFNWETYSDTQRHLSVSYPKTWIKVARENAIFFSPDPRASYEGQYEGIHLSVADNIEELTAREYFEKEIKPGQEGSLCTKFDINSHVPDPLKNEDIAIVEGLCGIYPQGPLMVIRVNNDIVVISASFMEVDKSLIYQIYSTFKYIHTNPTCTPRPKCLDTEPRCMMPITLDMCPRTN